ncbi:MAG: HRDC domain-containing protein [Proteobacteria bacterium]|nr:HRDC domain-containing protein [Pseudomonadota bacterium]
MFKVITIPFDRSKGGFDEEVLNRFVLNKHVKSHRAEFFQDAQGSYWTVFLEYDPALEKPSARETEGLDDSQKLLLERLRAWRKERADRDGIPVYIIATNKELAGLVREAPATLEALKEVKGFGKGKVSKYGQDLIGLIRAFFEKT